MFWSIFLQSFILIIAIVIAGRVIAAFTDKRAKTKSDRSA